MEGFHYLCHKPNRMHSNKELIIHLILQHMRHVQLISLLETGDGIRRLGNKLMNGELSQKSY